MKKLYNIIPAIVLSISTLVAQNEVDALRYSQNFSGGTARSLSMGGAFSSLGGDMSSLSYNPAGIAIYRSSEFCFTPTFVYNSINGNYLNNTYTDYKYNFNFNNFGFVWSFKSSEGKAWQYLNFAFGYNNLNNFSKRFFIEGQNWSSSMLDQITYNIKNNGWGNNPNNWGDFENMAYNANLIYPDTLSNGNVVFKSDFDGSSYGEEQALSLSQKGRIGEYVLSFGGNYRNKLHLGATMGIIGMRYKVSKIYSEDDRLDTINYFKSFTLRDEENTSGAGVNFKFGLIYKPIDWLRLAWAIHSPTYYELDHEFTSKITSNFDDGYSSTQNVNRIYTDELYTPFRMVSGIGFVIKKMALLGIDYEFIDYSLARLYATDYNFINENQSIQNNYKATSNIRTGAEVRLGNFSIRGGYALYGSPYNSNLLNSKASQTATSLGFGVRDEDFYFDIAYVHSIMKEKYFIYDILPKPAELKMNNNQLMLTIGFKY